MTRRSYLDEGFFGTPVGEVTDDGRLFLVGEGPDSFFGYVEKDGVYVPAGLSSRTKLIDISDQGGLYLTCDSGAYSYGTKVGSVSERGLVYDADGRRFGQVGIGHGTRGNGDSGKGVMGGWWLIVGMPAAFLLVAAPVGAVLLWPALMGSASVSDASKVQLFVITLLGITAALLTGVGGDNRAKFTEAFPSMCFASWLACEVTLCVTATIMDSPLGFLDWALLLTFGSLLCLGWASAASCIAYLMLRAIRH